MDDGRLHFPATARNREAIAEVLEPLLPQRGLVLEIASGSGEHLCHFQQQFAASHPLLRWQGSDPDPLHRRSLQAWADALDLKAMEEPLDLDATAVPWPALDPALILCINMIHIAISPGLVGDAMQSREATSQSAEETATVAAKTLQLELPIRCMC